MIDILSYVAFFLTIALGYGVICLGLNLQWGQTGLFNVGVAGFAGVGAYASAILTTPAAAGHLGGYGLPILAGWLGGGLAAGLLCLLLGALTLRLRADYLAIATFGAAVVIQLCLLNLQPLTGGPFGISYIPRPFGSLAGNAPVFSGLNLLVMAVLAGVVWAALEYLTRSPWGRVLRAIREDEAAARALGKSPEKFRLQAFALGGFVMGLGGAAQAHFIGFIAPDNYLPILTFQVWTMLIVGGSGNMAGALLGSVLVWAIWSLSGSAISALFPAAEQARAASLQIVLIGVALCLVLILRPRGLMGEVATISARAQRKAAKRALDLPSARGNTHG